MANPKNQPKSNGLGATVIEYPAGTKRHQSAPQEPKAAPVHKLDLLQHIPDGHFKTYVADVAKMCSIHANTSLLVAISIASGVAERAYSVQYKNGKALPLGEYVIAGGLPGDAKSRMMQDGYQYPIFEAQTASWSAWKKFKDSNPDDQTPPPINFFVTDSTSEGIEAILSESSGYFSLVSAEQAVINTLTGMSYGGGDRKNNNDLPLKGFNGEFHASSRATRKGYRGKVVGSITCFSQPASISSILTASDGTGLAERFLLIKEPTQQGTRDHTKPYYPNPLEQNTYNRIVGDMAAKVLDSPQAFENLPGWRLSDESWMKIWLFRNEIEPQLAEGGKYSTATMRGMAAKVDIHIMKISALLAILYDNPNGEIPSVFVGAAISIMRDMLDYVYSLLIELDVIGTNALEDSVIAYLSEKRTATRRQFQQAKAKTKPWSELPKAGQGQAMRDTIDGLIDKGIVGEFEEFDASGKKTAILKMIA